MKYNCFLCLATVWGMDLMCFALWEPPIRTRGLLMNVGVTDCMRMMKQIHCTRYARDP